MVPPRLLTGQILINDHPMNDGIFEAFSGYVKQDYNSFRSFLKKEHIWQRMAMN